MKTASRTRDRGQSSGNGARYPNENNNHATEAIGEMYGQNISDDRQASRGHRREPARAPTQDVLSVKLATSTTPSSKSASANTSSSSSSPSSRSSASRGTSGGRGSSRGTDSIQTSPVASFRSGSAGPSAPLDAANKHFPLSDIDYESNPAAVAQELSNLQALRRMSMEASAATDPDLPGFSFNALALPPTGTDDDGDARRLFWVPARLHPELAPEGWKAFVEARVKEIRSPSGQSSHLSVGSPGQPGLRRKKSMLSRQIDNTNGKGAEGYRDGAEKLERRRSQNGAPMLKVSDLENLVNDPSSLLRKLSVAGRTEGANGKMDDDMPILPAPLGNTLRRSTRTTYRKDRGGLGGMGSGRARRQNRGAETDPEDSSPQPSPGSPKVEHRLQRVQTEPLPLTQGESLSMSTKVRGRPLDASPPESKEGREVKDVSSLLQPMGKPVHSPPSPSSSFEDMLANSTSIPPAPATPQPKQSSSKSSRRSTSPTRSPPSTGHTRKESQGKSVPVPQIVETPPQEPPTANYPERSSSHQLSTQTKPKRPSLVRQDGSTSSIEVQRPTSAGKESKDSLTPSATAEKRAGRSDSVSSTGTRKSSWGWLVGDSSKEKEREKEREKEQKEKEEKKTERDRGDKTRKLKSNKPDRDKDHARLDVIQKSIDGKDSSQSEKGGDKDREAKSKGEESRKTSSGDASKKDKDSGLFSTLFGGSRKKSGSESKSKSARPAASPERPQPQQNFYYTRFPIHIERAIYRLSHLKLANPRRPLLQQVLLSNFMYSYLAKVQMTQPTLLQQQQQQQQQVEEERRRQQAQLEYEQQQAAYQQQQYEQQQYDAQQQGDQQYYHYDDGSNGHVDYAEDSQMYEYDDDDGSGHHQHYQVPQRTHSHIAHSGDEDYEQQQYHQQYYSPSQQQQQQQYVGRDDMW